VVIDSKNAAPEPGRLSQPGSGFSVRGFAKLKNLVRQPALGFLCKYAMKSARWGAMRRDDPQAPETPSIHGDPVMESLLELLLPRIEAETGDKLFPTYSYFRVYRHGDVLHRHTDRPACEISLTLSLGYRPEAEQWPICLERDGVDLRVQLSPGDALLYKGVETPHWRERFNGEHAAQVFLHYVRQAGPYQDWIYDKRCGTASSPVMRRVLEWLEKFPHQRPAGEMGGAVPAPGDHKTMPLSLSSRVSALPEVLVQIVGDEAVILNVQTRACLTLGPVATRMWTLLNDSETMAAALESLLGEYDASKERMCKDLMALVEKLFQHGLVEIRPAGQ
jgi:hypothetical protein